MLYSQKINMQLNEFLWITLIVILWILFLVILVEGDDDIKP